MDIIDAGRAHIGVVGYPVNDNHLAGVAFIRRLNSRTAYHECLVDVHTGSHMGSAPLEGGQFHGPCLAAQLRCQESGQVVSGARQLFMPKGIHIIASP